MMKRYLILLCIFIILLFPLKAYASTTSVEVNVDGKIKKGEYINIVINMKGLESLYAASVNFTYDKNILNIVDITVGDSIKKHENEIMEIDGEVDSTNNKISYSFTFLGDKEGINGDGTLAVIKAEVLKDGNLSIGEDSINIKFVKRVGDNVENYDYKFIGYSTEKDVSSENKEDNDTNNKDESNNIVDENLSIPSTENNFENIIKEDNSSEKIEDKVDNNINKEENTFWNNILNGNIVESIVNNIKNFISNNDKEEVVSEEEDNKEYNIEKNNNLHDKVEESISSYDNNTNRDKNDEIDILKYKEENKTDNQDKYNIYLYFIGAILIGVIIYWIYKIKNR